MIRKRFLVYLCILGSCLSFININPVYAAVASDFTVNFFVGTDTTPPTTPVLQSVTPISSNQIDLQWLPSTDDVFLSGYRVYRNGTIIATTTLTSYSDAGLTASTLYTYQVDSFDSFYNISTSSTAQATTTLALPVIPVATTTPTSTSDGRGGSATRNPLLESFVLTPNRTSAQINWQTNGITQYILAWGRTNSYDSGVISSNVFSSIHQTEITDLEPNTKYYFELSAIDPSGIRRVIKADSFTTLPAFSTLQPINVQGFSARVDGSDVTLFWNNGILPSGSVVRIVRSHLYYPSSITDGALVYEGTGESFTDSRALMVRTPQFYTAFVITADKLVSSGALALAGRPMLPIPAGSDGNKLIETGNPTILVAPAISVIQLGTKEFFDSLQSLFIDVPYLISIPVVALAPGIKSIIVSVQDPSNQRIVSTYLLKLNTSGNAYEALIKAPTVGGQARISVEVFNYSAESVRQITTTLTFVAKDEKLVFFPDALIEGTAFTLKVLVSILLLLFLFFWFLLRRRRREDNL